MNDHDFTILIVDDNPSNLFTLETLLKPLDSCKVVQAESGEAALAATLEHGIDLILLDIQMPGMDGYETARHLKMTARTRDIPIIFLTAVFKTEEFIKRGYEVGAVDYLTKPLDDSQLLNRIKLYQTLHDREAKLQRALEKLKVSSEESFQALFEGSMDAIAITDLDHGFLDCNARAVKLFGYESKQKLINVHPGMLSPPTQPNGRSSIEFASEYIRRAMTDGAIQFEWVHQRRDGSLFIADILANAINWNGRPAVQGAIRDITERRRNEIELKQYKDHLEDIVQQRTAELVLARDAAAAANKAKSVFLANMSHELRTPLNAILGFSSLMGKDTQLPAGLRQNLGIINRSGEYLLSLINNVLEMAMIETGRVKLEASSFDLAALLRDVMETMSVRAQGKSLQLLIEQSPDVPRYIFGDESRLRQILVNLIGNAIKFTPQGRVTLRINIRNETNIEFQVEDTGPGIPQEDKQRIFEPFVQLGEHSVNQGCGLGLTISRQFVEMMGGCIRLESAPDKGSVFIVELPLTVAHEADVMPAPAVEIGEVVGLAAGQPEYRLLIVEDQLENQLLLAKLLESVGFQVKAAANGEQGVQLFQSWRPDLIWMDRRMPVMGGIAAAKAIRELPGGREVKIVAVSASAFNEHRDEMLAAGMDDFVRKPYQPNEIFECLSRQLGVGFIRENPEEIQAVAVELTPQMLAALSEELRLGLEAALESLEREQIDRIIEQVGTIDLNLKTALIKLVDDFDYPAILKALRSSAG